MRGPFHKRNGHATEHRSTSATSRFRAVTPTQSVFQLVQPPLQQNIVVPTQRPTLAAEARSCGFAAKGIGRRRSLAQRTELRGTDSKDAAERSADKSEPHRCAVTPGERGETQRKSRCRHGRRLGEQYEGAQERSRKVVAPIRCANSVNGHSRRCRVPGRTTRRCRRIQLLCETAGAGQRGACRTAVTRQRASERRGGRPENARADGHNGRQPTKHSRQLQSTVRRSRMVKLRAGAP